MPLVLVYSAAVLTNWRQVWQARTRWRFRLAGALGFILVLSWIWSFAVVDMERFLRIL
jgi:hypothetical protein